MTSGRPLRIALAMPWVVVALAAPALSAGGAAARPSTAAESSSSQLASDLSRLLAARSATDPRLERLVSGHRPGEIAYFVALGERKTMQHRAALERAGVRILRDYRTLDVFAAASSPRALRRAADLPGVARLAPIELVEAAQAEPEVDQSRATTADVGAPPLWNQGFTGAGVRIAVLDTGLERRTRISTTAISVAGRARSTRRRSSTRAASSAVAALPW